MNLGFKRAHFIGIGGIGMSALARLFLSQGIKVSGSDSSDSEITKKLKKEGADIFLQQNPENIDDNVDVVIYTIAVSDDNKELKKAFDKLGQDNVFTYAEMLGKVSNDFYTIAVSGTHGKTTTTAMIVESLQNAGLKPTAIIGSLLSQSSQNPGSNFVKGSEIAERKILVVEACEYGRSFLNLNPDILVITNIEEDHLDYYKNIDEIKETFEEMITKINKDGFVVANFEDNLISSLKISEDIKKINYSEFINQVPELKVFGDHNVENAAAALGAASVLIKEKNEFEWENFRKGLSNFNGTWRRLEFKGKTLFEAFVYDDYAHHPSEIKASLYALKQNFPDKKIIAIFQPHLYSRTKVFLNDFAKVFAEKTDSTFVLPIYAAREKNDNSIKSEDLVHEINKLDDGELAKAEFCNDFFEVTRRVLPKEISGDSVIVVLGAGDIYKVANMLGVNY